MEQIFFERPREKLQQYGASSLTNTELLQVIIGSGSNRTPVAKIARRIASLLNKDSESLSYRAFMSENGIGIANALKIIASLELGKRFSKPRVATTALDVSELRKSRKPIILYQTVNGDGKELTSSLYTIKNNVISSVTARRICAKVLSDNAWGVRVAIGYGAAPVQPGMFELSLATDLKDLTARLQINLMSFEYVTKTETLNVYKATS